MAIGSKNNLLVGNERDRSSSSDHYSMSSAKANEEMHPYGYTRAMKGLYYRGGEAFRQYEAWEPVTSDELDRFLPDIWFRRNPAHRWEFGEVCRKRSDGHRRKRQERPNRLKRR